MDLVALSHFWGFYMYGPVSVPLLSVLDAFIVVSITFRSLIQLFSNFDARAEKLDIYQGAFRPKMCGRNNVASITQNVSKSQDKAWTPAASLSNKCYFRMSEI